MLEICKLGEEVLQSRASDVKDIDERIIQLVDNMRKTMYESNGIGLAAPQIGESIQLAIMDISQGENPDEFLVLINPTIIRSEEQESDSEGCLSIPGISAVIDRQKKIQFRYIDLKGKENIREFEDLKARVVQHEIDHLNGILIIDRLSSLKKQLVKKEIKKLKQNGEW
jgi:peptide deformylase